MRTYDTSRGLLLGVAAGLAAALAGCGLPGTNGQGPVTLSPSAVLAAAVSRLDSPTGRTAKLHATMSLGGLGDLRMSGVQQFAPTPALDVQVDGAVQGSSTEVILKDGIEYVKVTGAAASLSGGKQWLMIDLSKLGAQSGGASLGSALKINQNTDAAQQMKLLLTSGDLKKIGDESVDGARTTHYGGSVDPATMLRKQAGSKLSPDELKQLQDTLQSAGVTDEHIDVWLDKAGLPVEMKVALQSAAGAVTVDEHFSDWGTPVNITPPPADQVLDISKLGSGG